MFVPGIYPASVLQFFKPKDRFLKWMRKEYAGQRVYDVGAGTGHVSETLRRVGVNAIPMDLGFGDNPEVFLADGTSFPYEPDSVVMLCRPCHGGFPLLTIMQAQRRGVATILYVGLERNRLIDLDVEARKFKRVLTDVGDEGENVWRYTR